MYGSTLLELMEKSLILIMQLWIMKDCRKGKKKNRPLSLSLEQYGHCAFLYFSFVLILLDRLGNYGLAEFQIEGDGNCQVCFTIEPKSSFHL